MIKKFIPQDFEECLMGLPIVRWIIDDDARESNMRPVMVVNHLSPLKGIRKEDKNIHIRAYTDLDEIINSDIIPHYFKVIVDQARNRSIGYSSLGSFMNTSNFTRRIFPMLIALNSQLLLKSYMKDRRQDLKILINNSSLVHYNEILYEFIIERIEFTSYYNDTFLMDDLEVNYFIAYNNHGDFLRFVLMFPNNRIIRFTLLENAYGAENIDEIFLLELSKMSISEEYRKICLELYNRVFTEFMKGSL